MTQEELAQRARLSRTNLSAIETGKREVSLKTLRALAVALDIRPGQLADGIAPGQTEVRPPLSREALERAAESAVRGTALRNSEEKSLASLLRGITACRLSAALSRTEKVPRGKAFNTAWLKAVSRYSPAVLRSAIERASEHGRMR